MEVGRGRGGGAVEVEVRVCRKEEEEVRWRWARGGVGGRRMWSGCGFGGGGDDGGDNVVHLRSCITRKTAIVSNNMTSHE